MAAQAFSPRPVAHMTSQAPPSPTADVSCPQTRLGRCPPGSRPVPSWGGWQLWFPALPLLTFKYWFGVEIYGLA